MRAPREGNGADEVKQTSSQTARAELDGYNYGYAGSLKGMQGSEKGLEREAKLR